MRVSDLRRSPLLREVGLVFAWKVLQLGLTVVGGFLVARALGPGEYGVYAYALTWTQLLILPITLGFPTVVMREVGAARVHGRWGEVRGLFVWVGIWTIFTWILVSLAVVGLALHVPGMLPERQSALIHLLPMLLFMGWGGIFSASLRGLERIPRANFPVGQIWVVALFAALYVHGKLHLNAALLTQVTAAGFALLVYGWWIREFLPRDFWNARTQYLVRAWMASALPLFVVGTLFTLNGQIDILMLGALRSSNEIGLYRLANRLAGFIGFFLVVANAVIAPRIVQFHERGQYEALQRFIRGKIRLAFLGSAALAAAYVFLGRWLLGLAGSAYRAAYPTLLLMAAGQLVNVGAGSVGWILSMTRNERDMMIGVGVSVALNVLLNLLLTPRYGYFGTALATALAMAVWNVLLSYFVWKRFRIRVSVL